MLSVRSLDAGYGALSVLRNVSLHVNRGEIVALIGANGAGKTTLLKTLSGLLPARAGDIRLSGERLNGLPAEVVVARGCAQVPEGRQVFAPMTVEENLQLGAFVKHNDPPEALRNETEALFRLFPILRDRRKQLAGTLSGGEQQMLAIGRALLSRPSLLMLDEPSMGIAPLVVREIFKTIVRLRDEGRTILVVEQNARAALKIADRGYVIETGSIMMEGTAEELLGDAEVQRAYLGKDYRDIGER